MLTQKLQEHARQLLEAGKVDCLIGYEVSPRKKTRPVFVYNDEETEKLVWNSHASFNLTRYLHEKFYDLGENGTIAIVVKPCDSKALNVLVAEKKIDRSRVYVIGMECDGILSSKGENLLQFKCENCELEKPLVYDYLISNDEQKSEIRQSAERKTTVEMLEALQASEKVDFWLEQFDRCLRCYACRRVCPMCDCPTCLFERDDSLWVGASSGVQEKRAFHLGRAFHLAGRCIGCNECERVCPVDIPISLLNQKIAQVIENTFGFRAGFESVFSPLVTRFGIKE